MIDIREENELGVGALGVCGAGEADGSSHEEDEVGTHRG